MPEGEWCMMQTNRDERACELARWIVENNATVRAAAKRFGISKSTVHKDLSERLRQIDRLLYEKVRLVLEQNKAERHLRGGDATRRKYLHAGTHVPENHFFPPRTNTMLIGTYSTSAATETTIPMFLSSLTNSHLLYETSIPHCVTHKTDSRNVFINQHGVIKRKKSEKTARNILLFVSVFRIMCLKLYIREG